jgi:tRNA-dihydrouridine synthase
MMINAFDELIIPTLAEQLQDCGIQALTIHGRTLPSTYQSSDLATSPIFKGIPDLRQTRIAMLRATKEEELMAIMEDIRQKFG